MFCVRKIRYSHTQKGMKCLMLYMKVNSKWVKKLNVYSGTVKIIKEHIEGKFHDVSVDSDFMDMTPKAQTSKTKI